MKKITLPLCLLLGACVAPIDTTDVNNASVSTITAPETGLTTVTISPRPSASVLDSSVVGSSDQQLSGEQLRQLVSGKMVYSQKLDNPSESQVGNFDLDGTMRVSTGGKTIDGNWKIQSNQLCYLLSGKEFCSSVHRSAYDFRTQPVYYFRRSSGEPTVVITGIS